MVAPSEFQSYLEEICRRYERWWTVDGLTETISDRQASFSFEQKVQTEEKDSEGKPQKVTPPIPVFKGIQDYIESEHILLVGSPGVGKSALLLQCLAHFANAELKKSKPRIPVLVRLKEYTSERVKESRSGILSLIKDAFNRQLSKLRPRPRIETSDIEELLNDERLILLLDGLNEMPADTYRTHLIAFREEYDQIPLICSARELDSGDLGIKRQLKIQPLSPTEIDRFLQECMPDQPQKVLRLLHRDNRELSRTPFVLWMLYDLFQEQDVEVETLGKAFRQFFRSFKRYKEDAPVSEERRRDWRLWLEHLAFTMLNDPDPRDPGLVISEEQAENSLIEKFGERYGTSSRIEELLKYHLLEKVSEKRISFHHQLIQEYYAAECLEPQLAKFSDEKLKYYLNSLKWTESLAISMSLVESKALTESIVVRALDVDFYLGARLAGAAQSSLQHATVNVLIQKNFTPSLTVWILEQTQSSNALPFLIDVLKNGCSDTRWRAAQALGNFADEMVLLPLIEALRDHNSSVRRKAAESLGKLGNLEITPHLCQLLNDEDWLVRSFVVEVLGKLEGSEPIDCLKRALKHEDSTVRSKAAEYLGQRIPQEVIALLHEEFASSDTDTKRTVLKLLGETKNVRAIPILVSALSEDNWMIRSEAVSQIGLLGIWLDKSLLKDALIALTHILKSDPEASVRSSAAIYLGIVGNSQVVPVLIEALSQNDSVVRFSAANALGRLQDKSAISALIHALQDNNYVCKAVIGAICALSAVEALPAIRKLVNSKVVDIRREAILTLGFIGDSKDLPYLYKGLQDKEFSIRLCAAYSLSLLNNRKGIPTLEDAIETGNKDGRELALKGLKNFKGKIGLLSIISRAFKDDEYSIRKASIDFLEFFRDNPEVVSQLKIALNSQNENICRNAMDAAKTLGDPKTLFRLRQLTEKIAVVERPLEAIAAIQSRCGFYNYDITQSEPSQKNEVRKSEDLLHSRLDILTQEVKKVSEEPKRVIHAQNYFEQGTHAHTHNYANDEALKREITELRQLVTSLQQTHRPTSEVDAVEIIDVEFHTIQKTDPPRWQAIQRQLKLLKSQILNPEGHLKATKATLAEIAKHYLEDSVVSKALVTYIDTLSAETELGE